MLNGCVVGSQDPAPVTSYGGDKGAGSAGIHTVLDGDTVYSISQRYNLPIRDIVEVNALYAPYKLRTGFRMKLPPPREYKVRDGDTLYGIARTFEVTTNGIARLNNLRSPYVLKEGQIVRLPSSVQDPETSVQPSVRTASLTTPAQITPPEKPRKTEARTARTPLPKTTPGRSSSKFLKPVSGKTISSFGPKANGLHNDGINIRVPRGTPVRAAENGVVVYAGNELEGYGNLVLVRHADRWMTAYAHLDKIMVKRGATIKRGASLGTVGSTGQVDEPQLHFEIRRGTKALDPKKYS